MNDNLTVPEDIVLIIKIIVFFTYVSAVLLDFFSQQRQFQDLFKSNKIAAGYVIRNKLALVSRGFSFAIAPALGFLALTVSYKELLELFFISSLFGFILILVSYFNFLRKYKSFENKLSKKIKVIFAERFIGYFAFSVAINAPFVLNIIAAAFPDMGLWLVQMAPILTAISTAYIIFYYDTRLASLIDSGDFDYQNALKFLNERIIGRLIAFLIITFSYFYII
tara:strand:- start:7739 stop:8407 length:669 start_codon:yes stop_codon:yes gene_type:complete